jgi:hypothetical protein
MKKLETPVIPIAYSKPKAAAACDCGVDFVEEHVLPELRVIRRGSKVLIPVVELERWLRENSEAPMGEQVA